MHYLTPLYCACVLALAGCAPQMRAQLAGFDGSSVDPVSQERYSTECIAKAQVAKANVPFGYGSAAGIARAMEMDRVEQASFQGCMAEKGIKVTWVPVQTASAPARSTDFPNGSQ